MASHTLLSLRSVARPALAPTMGRRILSTSAVRASDHSKPNPHDSHDSHGSHDSHNHGQEEFVEPAELNKPWFWKKAGPIIALVLYVHLFDDRIESGSWAKVSEYPGHIRHLVDLATPSREADHQAALREYEKAREEAEYNLFLQTIEHPTKHPNAYPYTFDLGSPFNIPVGGMAKVPQYSFGRHE